MQTVADVLIESLISVGVRQVYGIVGDSLNGITDAIRRRSDKMAWIHVRHEEVAAFAAGAEAQLTQKLAVCAGSCGPGNLHLINGLFDCQRNRVPVLAIAAQIPAPEIGSGYFQETKPEILFQTCSVFCEVVSCLDQVPRLFKLAMQTAISKKGVAVLVISPEIALAEVNASRDLKPSVFYTNTRCTPDANALSQMANILNNSEKITFLCGEGCRDAHEAIMAVASLLKAPIVHTLRGKEYIEPNNPYSVGMTGFIGFASGYYAMEACDTLLLLGTSFPYRQFYPTQAKIIQVDSRGEQLGKRCALDLGVVGTIKDTLSALLPFLKQKTSDKHLKQALSHFAKSKKELAVLAIQKSNDKIIHPQYLAQQVSDLATENAIFTCDVGSPTVWAARYFAMNGQRSLIGSFNHGSMANALAQALGAQVAYPERQVIALCGDGGLSMLLGDLITLKQYNLPIKVIVVNNGTLGFVELEMKVAGFVDMGTQLNNPNFSKVAAEMGFYTVRVEQPADLSKALQQAFAHPGPALVDVLTNPFELIMPPKIKMAQVKGFSLYMVKAIMNGKGDDVFELIKTNLWDRY